MKQANIQANTWTFLDEIRNTGKLWQNGYNESSNSVLADACLNKRQFRTIREARFFLDDWIDEYNDC